MDAITSQLCEEPAFDEGRAAAEAEIGAGQLGYRIYGKVNWQLCEGAAALLRERFGLKLQVDGYCLTTIDVAAKAEGYNQRMQEEISSRLGHDVIEAAFREVERKHKKARPR